MDINKCFETYNESLQLGLLNESQKLAAITAKAPLSIIELEKMIKINPSIINEVSVHGFDLLQITCLYLGTFSSVECLLLLLTYGVNYNKIYFLTGNPLHLVAQTADDYCLNEAIKLLVDAGCDINNCDYFGSVLHELINRNSEKSLECAQYLIELGVDVDLVGRYDNTCLMNLCECNVVNEVTYTLLSTLIRLSDCSKIDEHGLCAYDRFKSNKYIRHMLNESEISMLRCRYKGSKSAAKN